MKRWVLVILGILALVGIRLILDEAPVPPSGAPNADVSPGTPAAMSGGEPSRREELQGGVEPDEGRVRVSGTVTVVDHLGREFTEESGTVRLASWPGQGPAPVEDVGVVEGSWEVLLEPNDELYVSSMTLGGRAAYVEEQIVPFRETGPVHLRARWPRASTLRVVSEQLGVDLSGVMLVRDGPSVRRPDQPDVSFLGTVHPGPVEGERIVLRDGVSPIGLPTRLGTETYWVRAPDHAWGMITIDYAQGGERILSLSLGGSVSVALRNLSKPDSTLLRIWQTLQDGSASTDLYREIRAEPGVDILVEHVRPATYVLRAEMGRTWSDPVVLGSASVEVVAGEVARATLDLEEPPGSPLTTPVALSGRLIVPPSWGEEAFALNLEPLDAPVTAENTPPTVRARHMSPVDVSRGSYAWSAGRVPPGRYRVEVSPWFYKVLLDVPAGGLTDAEIRVPGPGDVVVHLRDLVTGEPVSLPFLFWSSVHPEIPGGGSASVRSTDRVSPFRFRAPLGRIRVSTSIQAGYQQASQTFEVDAGANELTLHLERSQGIRVVLRDGDAVVRSRLLTPYRAEQIDGIGESVSWGAADGGIIVGVSKPGRYRVTVPDVDGFEPVPVQEVEVPAGETVELVIELKRKTRDLPEPGHVDAQAIQAMGHDRVMVGAQEPVLFALQDELLDDLLVEVHDPVLRDAAPGVASFLEFPVQGDGEWGQDFHDQVWRPFDSRLRDEMAAFGEKDHQVWL